MNKMATMKRTMGIGFLALLSASALALDVTVVTLEGDEKRGELTGLSEADIKVGGASVALKNVAEISLGSRSSAAHQNATLHLRNGDVIHNVKILQGDDTKLKFTSNVFGEQSLDNKFIRAITFELKDAPPGEAADALLKGPAPKEDILLLPKGDTVSGFFEKFTDKDMSFNAGGQSRVHAFEQIAGLRLAPLEELKPREGFLATIELSDGSVVTGKLMGLKEKALQFEILNGQALSVLAESISSIRFKGGKLVHLADLTPVSVEEKPYAGGAPVVYRWRRDKSASAGGISIGGNEYRRGVGVHSYSRLTYALDGKYEKFLSDVGIDSSANGACAWRVVVDGKDAAGGIAKAGEPAQAVKIEIKNAKQMELICDYGADDNDAGDHLNWANARLIKP